MLRGAIIGAGQVAANGHLPGWLARDDVRIVAAVDPRPESRAAFDARLPGLLWRDKPDVLAELLDAVPLDFVDVCSPPAAHAKAIRAALEQDLHVLCEKPLVLNETELGELAALARERGLVLAAVHNWRHAPPVVAATEIVRSGAIGRVLRCRWEVIRERPAAASVTGNAPNWRLDPAIAGGGILVDHGWHAAYVVASWMPGSLASVRGRLETRKHRDSPLEDTADLLLTFGEKGAEPAEAEIFLTWAGAERRNTVTIEGSAGTIRIEGRRLEVARGSRSAAKTGGTVRELSESLSEGSHHPSWFGGASEEFLRAIRSPEDRPARSLTESALCLAVIRLAEESSRDGGRTLPAPPMPSLSGSDSPGGSEGGPAPSAASTRGEK